jgi:hypothetical protein
MRTIEIGKIGLELIELLNERDPVEEDIGILDENGNLIGVIITKDAYDFFIRKVEEEEDRHDLETVNEFHNSGEKEMLGIEAQYTNNHVKLIAFQLPAHPMPRLGNDIPDRRLAELPRLPSMPAQ